MNSVTNLKLKYLSPDFRTVDVSCESFFLSTSNLTINKSSDGVTVTGWDKANNQDFFEAEFK